MSVSYKKLWKLLIDREISQIDLQRAAEITPNTMTKMHAFKTFSIQKRKASIRWTSLPAHIIDISQSWEFRN